MAATPNASRESSKAVDPLQNDWVALRDEFPEFFGDLDSTVFYGIPESLIEAVRRESPQFFTERQLEFERKLACALKRQHAVGLLFGKPVQSSLFEERSPMTVSPEDFEALGWKHYGLTYAKANQASKEIESRAIPFREQLVAYAGWLVTNPVFVTEIAGLRKQEEKYLASTPDKEAEPFVVEMNAFLNRWQLCSMASWDLPEPQGPNLAGVELPAAAQRGNDSIKLELPLTTRLPARFPVRDVISEIRNQIAEPHLAEWQEILSRESTTSSGIRRFSHMLKIQFFRNVVMALRYLVRFEGQVEALDRAFGLFLGVGEDSVKKLRLEIKRRLDPAAAGRS